MGYFKLIAIFLVAFSSCFWYAYIMNSIKHILKHDLFKYLVAGVITTIFYLFLRDQLFLWTNNEIVATVLANGSAILLAFVLNDIWVFSQARKGWLARLVKFFTARLSSMGIDVLLTFVFVTQFPNIVGQFVNNDISMVNRIVGFVGQILIVVTNYLLSKFLIFKD